MHKVSVKKSIPIILLCLWVIIFIARPIVKEWRSETVRDGLNIHIDNETNRVYISKNKDFGSDFIELSEKGLESYLNIYFAPPDTIYVLNYDGNSINDIKSDRFKIVDVMSHDIFINNESSWEGSLERIRYDIDGKHYERYNPGNPRIAYRLTYDTMLCSLPLSICFEPELAYFTVCDSTGRAISISDVRNIWDII